MTTTLNATELAMAPLIAAHRGWTAAEAVQALEIAKARAREFGAAVQGDGFTTFPVPFGWDGYKFNGYFSPTAVQLVDDSPIHPGQWQPA
jgi:hypothetical protein